VGLLAARELGAHAVVVPVSCNTAIEGCDSFARVIRTRIGSPFVIEGMQRAGTGVVVGFEANGGFLHSTEIVLDDRRLAPLPTRDAVLPALAVLAAARRRGVPVSALLRDLPQRFTASDRIQNFPTEQSRALIVRLQEDTAVRDALLGELCGALEAADVTDGLRMRFANGEIIHLRPSGNAPELRCYAEAGSAARAGALTGEVLKRVGQYSPQSVTQEQSSEHVSSSGWGV